MAIFSNTDEKKSPLLLLKRARVSLQKEKPFFSDLIFYLKFNEADSFPSMAVDPFGNLYFNAEWVSKLTEAKLKGVLCHEVCLSGDTFVGNKEFEDVVVGDDVVCLDGNRYKVLATSKRKYVGDILRIKARGMLPLLVTPNHRILTLRSSGWKFEKNVLNKSGRGNHRVLSGLSWKKSQDITAEDYLLFPKIKALDKYSVVDMKFDKYVVGNAWSVSSKLFGKKLNEQLAFFLGLFIANGWTDKNVKSNQIGLVFHKKHIDFARKLQCVILKELGLKSRLWIDGNCVRVVWTSVVLKRFLREQIGTYAYNKNIPDWILRNPNNSIVYEFLKGMFFCDGWVNKPNNSKKVSISYCSVSKALILNLQTLLGRFEIMSNLYEREGKPVVIFGKVFSEKARKQYILRTTHKKIFDITGNAEYFCKNRQTKYYIDLEGFFAVKVSEVKKEPFADWVYNVETKMENYVANNLIVHNCHLAFLHIPRAEKFAADEVKQFVWNLAIDCQANYLVKKNNMELPDDVACRPDNYGNSVHIDLPFWKYEVEDIENKAAEKIYYEIYDKIPKAKARAYAQGFKGKPIRIGFDYHLDKKGQGQKDKDGKEGQGQGQELSKEDVQRIQQQWKDRLINALYRAQGIGNQPAGMDRWIKELLEPKIDWRAKLNRFVTEGLPFDYSFRRPHKRSEALGYYCPSYVNESLKVGVFIDTSGSIGDEELKAFKSECVSIAKSFECIEMVLGYLDTQMYPPVLVENGNVDKIMASMPKGGGGTDMREVFNYIGKDGWCADLELVVIFTDLDTPLPTLNETKGRKVLWVVPKRSEHYVKKFDSNLGEVVIIE